MDTAGAIVLTIFILLIVAALGWVFFTRWRAARLGLPPPPWNPFKSAPSYGAQPAPSGPIAWITSKFSSIRNRNNRTAAGAYEGSGTALGSTSNNRRGFGALDPDEAWDARVGTETDYYGPYDADDNTGNTAGGRGRGGDSYNMNLATPGHAPAGYGDDDLERGRPRSRSPGLAPGGARRGNPFDDDAEPSNISLRGVSPRPIDTSVQGQGKGKGVDPGSAGSPSERRSVFRENV